MALSVNQQVLYIKITCLDVLESLESQKKCTNLRLQVTVDDVHFV
jgi:hypothetical protein